MLNKNDRSKLEKYWDHEKNNDADFKKISLHSKESFWWRCEKGHLFENKISNVTKQIYRNQRQKIKCDECLGFANQKPELLIEWDYQKNQNINPKLIRPFSKEVIWWKCKNGHSWQSSLEARSAGNNPCQICFFEKNNLKYFFPEIAKEFSCDRNSPLTPELVAPYSDKKVWWKCHKGHEWQSTIANRTNRGNGCPGCSGRAATEENNLSYKHPELMKIWDFKKNVNDPKEVLPSSNKKYWWRCDKGHSFKQSPNILNKGVGCGYCAGYLVCEDNNLEYKFPEISKEWNYEKNYPLKPSEIVYGSHKKVWWKCKKGHEWKTKVTYRTFEGKNYGGTNCPHCFPQTSKEEIRAYAEIKYIFSDTKWREKIYGKELDIFIPNLNLGIEFDGYRWHKNKYESDKEKNVFFQRRGVSIIRFRQGLDEISENDICFSKHLTVKIFHVFFEFIRKEFDILNSKLDKYLQSSSFKNDSLYRELVYQISMPLPGKKLFDKYPELKNHWNYEKNSPLLPEYFSFGSNESVWWKCSLGHEFKQPIYAKTVNIKGCPICTGQQVSSQNSLASLYPEIAKEWHHEKNKDLKPSDFAARSGKKVWWKCIKNPEHEWITAIGARVGSKKNGKGTGCPHCYSETRKV